jgi:hypothetical protein
LKLRNTLRIDKIYGLSEIRCFIEFFARFSQAAKGVIIGTGLVTQFLFNPFGLLIRRATSR